jgi:hypothetical protein
MSTRYIDIDSSYRDRLSYPEVGEFVIPVNSRCFVSSPYNAVDPVILSFPYDTGLATAFAINAVLGTLEVTLGASSSDIVNFYNGNYIQIGTFYAKILIYNSTTKVIVTDKVYPGPLPVPPTQYTIRYQLPTQLAGNAYQDTTAALSADKIHITLGAAASNIDNAYTGQYLFLLPPVTLLPWLKDNPTFAYQWALILSYNGTTKVATIQTPFLIPPPIGTVYEILRFSYDNFRSLKYYGTEIFNNPSCCNVSLTNLVIPSYLPVSNTNAGYITDYPYVWVSVYSDKASTYHQPIISNSPASTEALFKCVIGQLQPTKYLSLSSVTNGQSVYFKQNDNLQVKILLPNGEPVKFLPSLYTLYTGTFTFYPGLGFPIPPDPQAQIQITLEVTQREN